MDRDVLKGPGFNRLEGFSHPVGGLHAPRDADGFEFCGIGEVEWRWNHRRCCSLIMSGRDDIDR